MREILFRGKRIDNDKWIEGSLVVAADRYFIYVLVVNELVDFEVDPETVGQYTGLEDKNGIKIFEGDIVEYEEPDFNEKMRASVRYGGFSGNYPAFDIGDHDFDCNGLQLICVERLAKVLGNKFDNPKLLNMFTD